jgi:hypothetical protein
MFKTSECAWAQIALKCLGRTIVGVTGLEFKESVEKEHLYGAGDKPIDIQTGNIKPEGNIKLLKFEVDMLNDAAQAAGYDNILRVPHTLILITCTFKKLPTDTLRTVDAIGVAFTEMPIGYEQNAKKSEITIPFLAMQMRFGKAS